jgi:3-carboxy-cis,cis-muconate cycloisomerase
MAADVVFLSSTEVGEVAEPQEAGRGGSSAMPHKHNPVSATVILAAHAAAGGHVTTLLNAMAAQNQRPAGAWQAEWHALPQLFGLASGALREGRRLAEGLLVDAERMRSNLGMTNGLVFAAAAASVLAPTLGRGAAHHVIEKAAEAVRNGGTTLEAALGSDPAIPPTLRKEIAAAFDLETPTAAAAAVTDHILAATKPIITALTRKKR